MVTPQTLFDKIWRSHVIKTLETGEALLWIDRHLVHEGSRVAFDQIAAKGLKLQRPDLTFGVADHYVPTDVDRVEQISNPRIVEMIRLLEANRAAHGVRGWTLGDPDQGIVHVVGPEQGITLPGMILVCGDSHTSTHGALGSLAFGIGASEVAHVLATQTLWQKQPKTLRVTVSGQLNPGVSAKDLILAVIAHLGAAGATGHVIEYAGPAIEALSIEQRLTLCNMSIEAGARAGMVSPDEKTIAYLKDRPFAPKGKLFEQAADHWRRLATDPGALFDREVALDGSSLTPMVTWGSSPDTGLSISEKVPEPRDESDRKALAYMGLNPGTALTDIEIQRAFIGSCTNSRIEDLRAAAEVLKHGKVKVPTLISPGSRRVKAQAEAEGLDRIFKEAGAEWRGSGCSMCVAMNGEGVASGERCASTSNRNFVGRQGVGSRTHLVSPAMAAAAALNGRFTDCREYLA